jgi:hypothetical protein
MLVEHHIIMVHSIAQLALFRNGLPGRVVGFAYESTPSVLVAIQYHLPCYKNNKQQPGAQNMTLIFFQEQS